MLGDESLKRFLILSMVCSELVCLRYPKTGLKILVNTLIASEYPFGITMNLIKP